MAKFLIFILFISSFHTKAQKEGELIFGALTFHYINYTDASKNFANKVTDDGSLISNPTFGYTLREFQNDHYVADSIFIMKDSIGSNAFEYLRSFGQLTDNNFYLGLIGGFYFINNKNWKEKGFRPPLRISINSNYGLVPVFGLQVDKKFKLSRDYYIKFNNLLTLYVTNHTLSIGKTF